VPAGCAACHVTLVDASKNFLYFSGYSCTMWRFPSKHKVHFMARKPTRAAAKKKQPAAVETSESIEEQTRLFLKSGNKIDIIQSGVSGQPTMAVNKQIKLGNKQKTA
jgi:hypothetical protein